MKLRSGRTTNNTCVICNISDNRVQNIKDIMFEACDTPYIYVATCGCHYFTHKSCMVGHFYDNLEICQADDALWPCLQCNADMTEYCRSPSRPKLFENTVITPDTTRFDECCDVIYSKKRKYSLIRIFAMIIIGFMLVKLILLQEVE